MRKVVLFVFYLIVGCSKNDKEVSDTPVIINDTLPENPIAVDSSQLIKVNYGIRSYTYFYKDAYKRFGNWYKKINPNYVLEPDIAREIYMRNELTDKSEYSKYNVSVGPQFYIMYSYFLQQQNGLDSNVCLREKYSDIFFKINSIYSNVHFDDSYIYFRHQRSAIAAYAEFAIYNFNKYGMVAERNYSISKQKELFIQMLRQKVLDELDELKAIENSWYKNLNDIEEKEHKTAILKIIDELDTLIINHFDLHIAQQFVHNHYL